MGKVLFLLFTLVPVAEIALLLRVGELVGGLPTVALVILTGLLGAALAKHEGLRVISDWQGALAEGRMPSEGVASGLLVLVGGVLLVTPGLLTDVVGFSLLIPQTRRVAERWLKAFVARRIAAAQVELAATGSYTEFHHAPRHAPPSSSGDVIDMPPQEPR